jgi:hypothetical protein
VALLPDSVKRYSPAFNLRVPALVGEERTISKALALAIESEKMDSTPASSRVLSFMIIDLL